MTHMTRFCLILQAISCTTNLLKQFPASNSEKLTNEIQAAFIKIANEISNEAFVINSATVQQAKLLTEYCNINKMLLSSYQINPVLTFDQSISELLRSFMNMPQIAERFTHLDTLTLNKIKKALFLDSSLVEPVDVTNGNGKISKAIVIFKLLEDLKLGTCKEKLGFNNKPYTVFLKVKHSDAKQDPQIGQTVIELGFDLKLFL